MDFFTAVLVVVFGTTILPAALYWEGGHLWAIDPATLPVRGSFETDAAAALAGRPRRSPLPSSGGSSSDAKSRPTDARFKSEFQWNSRDTSRKFAAFRC